MNLDLLCVILICWIIVLKNYGPISFVFAGTFCFTTYSIPALFGLVRPFISIGGHLAPASRDAVLITMLAWIFFLLTIAIPAPRTAPSPIKVPNGAADESLRAFITASTITCVVGFLIIVTTEGPLFFLAPRDEQTETLLKMLWRWVNALGLVAAVAARYWRPAVIFICALLVHSIAGDRTVIAITAFCALIVWGQGKSIRELCRGAPLVAMTLSALLIVFGKPIYIAIKLGSPQLLVRTFSSETVTLFAASFEPFLTFNLLDVALRRDFSMEVGTLLKGVLGQFLILPSAFDIDSNSFNSEFTQRFASRLTYGVAGNFWAHAWAVAGSLGVGLFATIYGCALRMLNSSFRRHTGVRRVLLALLASLIAVYAHRNSLDNLLSFVRQILLITAAMSAMAYALSPFHRSHGDRHFAQ